MEIDILIDSLTNCLVLTETGKEYDTEYHLRKNKITDQETLQLKQNGWKFDWSIPQKKWI